MGSGPYRPFRTDDVNLNSVQAAVREFADQLELARRGVIGYPAETISKGLQLNEQAIVRYNGPAANLLLPSAMKLGRGRGQVVVICHEGTGTLTVLPSQAIGATKADVLTSPVTLQPNQVAVLASDGYSTWFPVLGSVGPGAAVYGPWINTITLDAQGRVTAVAVATPVTSVKANSGGTPTTGAIEVDGVGCAVISMVGQVLTVTARDGRGLGSYRHAPGGSGLSSMNVAGVNRVTSVGTAATCAVNTAIAVPLVAPQRGGTMTKMDFRITTLGAGNGRMGLYGNAADGNLYPGALLADGGSISTATTGIKSATISVALTGGNLYWLVYNTDNAIALVAKLNGTDFSSLLGQPVGVSNDYNVAISVASTFGAMPSTFPAGGAYILSTAAVPWLRWENT